MKDKISAIEKTTFENAKKIRYERGCKIGERKKALEVAKALLEVLDEETIAQSTGLSIEEVKSLK